METTDLLSLVEHLEVNIDDLEDSLEPLLAAALSATTKKLPVLDKAKLYVLIVYSIESLLFSYLRLNGVQAKEHPVFKELTRVKQYFEKIKVAEAGPAKPRENMSLNKQATGRVIKHALAGNDKYDLQRAEREAKEKVIANRKLKMLTSQVNERTAPPPIQEEVVAAGHEDSDSESSSDEGEISDEEMADATPTVTEPQPVPVPAQDTVIESRRGKNRSRKQQNKWKKVRDSEGTLVPPSSAPAQDKKKKKPRPKKKRKVSGAIG